VVLNTGTTTWTPDAGYVLGDPSGELVWPLPDGTAVAPGGIWIFAGSVPVGEDGKEPWSVRHEWRMLRQGKWWFGDLRSTTSVVSSLSPPLIEVGPASTGAFQGMSAEFDVRAFGLGSLTYEWQRNGLPLLSDPRFGGADSSHLVVLEVDRHVTGEFRCVVTNGAGSVVSQPAELRLYSPRRRHGQREAVVIQAGEVPEGYLPWRFGNAPVSPPSPPR
jgi:hypothetical protein